MKWNRVEREITFQRTDSALYEIRKVVGWECSNCHHINWAERHPGVGCWSCGQRDEEFGKDAVAPKDHHPDDKLKIESPPAAPTRVAVKDPRGQ